MRVHLFLSPSTLQALDKHASRTNLTRGELVDAIVGHAADVPARMSLGTRIKAMSDEGYSNAAIARAMPCSASMVSKVLNGTRG